MRTNWSSNTLWEESFAYSRAVQIENSIEVSGTSALEDDKVIGVGDLTLQTEFIIKKIEHTLVFHLFRYLSKQSNNRQEKFVID